MAASRIAVVGAGLAGLSAALDLIDAGFAVEIFERSRLLGGRATSFTIDGIEVDNGQHVFLSCCSEFLHFVDRLGLRQYLHQQDRFEALVLTRNGVTSRLRAGALPPPWHLLASFVGYRHLAWPSKVKIARALSKAAQAQRSNASFADWLRECGQTEEALRAFWRPFFVPALNAPLEEVSAPEGAFVLSTAFLASDGAARFGYTTVPLARIAFAAAARAQAVHLSAPVTALDFDARREGCVLTVGAQEHAFDGVVLALTPTQLMALLGQPERLGLPPLEGFVAHPIVDAHLWHDGGSLGFDFAALLDSPVQWVFEKESGYICCSLSAADRYLDTANGEIVNMCWDELQAAIGKLRSAQLVRSAVTRNPEATFAARLGQSRPGPATAVATVTLAGSWTDTGWPDTMESAVRSGRAAATQLQLTLRGAHVA